MLGRYYSKVPRLLTAGRIGHNLVVDEAFNGSAFRIPENGSNRPIFWLPAEYRELVMVR